MNAVMKEEPGNFTEYAEVYMEVYNKTFSPKWVRYLSRRTNLRDAGKLWSAGFVEGFHKETLKTYGVEQTIPAHEALKKARKIFRELPLLRKKLECFTRKAISIDASSLSDMWDASESKELLLIMPLAHILERDAGKYKDGRWCRVIIHGELV